MHARHGTSLIALLTALAACPGATAETTDSETGSDPSSSTVTPTMSSGGPDEPTTTGTPDATTGAPTTGDATTGDPSTSGSSSTSATTVEESSSSSGESTETGAPDCAPAWTVPEVPADQLAAHDLQWVGCEYTACGPEDAPQPGEPSLLCWPFAIAGAPLEYLGLMHINESGAFTTDDIVAPDNFAWLDGARHIYRYDQRFYITTEADEPADQLDVFYTVRALELLREEHPGVWQQVVADTEDVVPGPTLPGKGWKNRLRSVVISFDTSPLYIAAGLSILDAAPTTMMNLDVYSNVAAISIDRETILGTMQDVGTRPIYQRPEDDENFLRYMREGLAETLVHEMLHTRVDRLNSVDEAMELLYDRRGDPDACAKFYLEETLVAASSLLHFYLTGGLSDTYIEYYDPVLDGNLAIVEDCPDFPMWEQMFGMPSGVDPRYDLRLVDLQ